MYGYFLFSFEVLRGDPPPLPSTTPIIEDQSTTTDENEHTVDEHTTTTTDANEDHSNESESSSNAPAYSSTSSNNDSTNDCHENASETFKQDPNDCSKFYICTEDIQGNWIKNSFTCPGILLFNEQLQGCDWPANVICKW